MTHASRTKEERALQIALEALEFYAKKSAWVKKQLDLNPTFCRADNSYDEILGFFYGGKKAREALAKIKEVMK